jgi:tetratricopeptide (TPR) repeat protein
MARRPPTCQCLTCSKAIIESLPTASLLLLVSYRPEYQHGWDSKTYYTQLRLDPLPPVSAQALLQALLGDDASLAPLTPLLITRTEGNPFFLEESVRTLVETGILVGEAGAYRLEQPLDTLHVPATVQAVLAARIDRLPAEEKRLLQTAAVIGTEVPLPPLQAIVGLPEDALHRGLAHLQAAEFLYETQLFPELAYTFTHALTHEVAYGSLLQERRRVLHAHILAALEQGDPDRLAEQVKRLAHHALRGERWDKALLKGDLHQAIPVLERCRELCEMGDLPGYFPWIASCLGYGYGLAGRVAEAIPQLEQAVQQSASTGRVGQALRIAYLGEVYGLAGRMDEAIDLARQALEYACEHKERGHQAHTLRLLGAIAAQREPPESALAEAHYRRALALTEELGMRPLQAHCHLGQERMARGGEGRTFRRHRAVPRHGDDVLAPPGGGRAGAGGGAVNGPL